MALTEQQKDEIHEALLKTNGDRNAAAAILDIDPLKLKDVIHACPALKERWATARTTPAPPSNIEVISPGSTAVIGPDIPAEVATGDEQKLAVQVSAEDQKFRKGLASIGLSGDELELAASLQAFHGKQFSRCVDMVSAGVSVNAIRLLSLIRKTEQEIANKEWTDVTDGEGNVIYSGEKTKWDVYHASLAEYRKMAEMVTAGAMARAKIDLWNAQRKNGVGMKKGKPGFQPLEAKQTNVHAAAGSTVVLQEKR